MAATLTVLYVYLYILLELENLSLLFGAIGLFVALSVVLYITRNVDWYTEEAQQLGTVTTSTVVPKN
jgi:inner membrane protein